MKIFLFFSIFWFSSFLAARLVLANTIAPEIEENSPDLEEIEPNPNEETIPQKENPIIKQWRNVEILRVLEGHTAAVMSLAFSPDGQILASGGSQIDASIYIWNPNSGRRLKRNRLQNGRVTAIAIAAEGELIVSSSDVAGVSLWEWQNRRRNENERWILGHKHNILSLTISPDNQVLITGGLDGIRLWNLRGMKPLYTLVRFELVTALALHPNGYILVSGTQGGNLKLWDLKTGENLREIEAHDDTINTLAFTPDGRTLISGSSDRTIKLWRSATGQLLNTLEGAGGTINAIAVHPSGLLFASGSRNGIQLWDIEKGETINNFTGYSDWVETVAFSPDGRMLASGGFDNQVKLWHPLALELREWD
ncbi:MAG: WD40 repeat domain-containing protein [Spirulina sp.]